MLVSCARHCYAMHV